MTPRHCLGRSEECHPLPLTYALTSDDGGCCIGLARILSEGSRAAPVKEVAPSHPVARIEREKADRSFTPIPLRPAPASVRLNLGIAQSHRCSSKNRRQLACQSSFEQCADGVR